MLLLMLFLHLIKCAYGVQAKNSQGRLFLTVCLFYTVAYATIWLFGQTNYVDFDYYDFTLLFSLGGVSSHVK